MHTYTDQRRYIYMLVLNKKTRCTSKVQWNTQTNMQIIHRCTQTQKHCKLTKLRLKNTIEFMCKKV